MTKKEVNLQKKTMEMNKIKSFEIIGLFGTDDIKIPFKDSVKILIGENGLGKTQVLNLFYFTLTKNFFRLSEYNFKNLTITFSDDKKIEISRKQVDELVDKIYKDPMVKELINEIGYSEFEMLRNKFLKDRKNWHRLEDNFIRSNTRIGRKFPIHHVFRVFEELEMNEHKQSNVHFDKCKKDIANELNGIEILYFPTYRRVEEDLYNLGYDEDELRIDQDNNLIQFGMGDVKRRFNNIQNTIDKLLKEGLAQFTKDILNVVIDDSEPSDSLLEKINNDDIEIILSRIGNSLPDSQKIAVKRIIAEKKFTNPLHAFLLQKLIDIYEKQKEIDNSVKIFRDACNKYLINKSVFYDESAIEIYIKSTRTNDKIDLKHLSSGEKQIVSMLSNVYLSETDKRFLILFDEPELSLSMMWQKQLLPDILNSKKCDFLLAVTHSPFIFDNELDSFAVGMHEYVNPSTINEKK
jgi:predicted ATP-dependent endonuclease of OLD family